MTHCRILPQVLNELRLELLEKNGVIWRQVTSNSMWPAVKKGKKCDCIIGGGGFG